MNRSQIRFMCRRGLLELDVLLLHFFDSHYDQLDLSMQEAFIRLLKEDDPILMQWLIHDPLDDINSIVGLIRKSHQG